MRWITARWPALASIIAAFLVIGLIYVTAEGRPELTYVEGKVRDGLAPLYGAVSGATGFFRHWVEVIRNYSRLEQENAELWQEIDRLKRELAALEQLREENARLREDLGFYRANPVPPVAAEIIARSPSNWFDKIVINRGTSHGLEPGDAVVTPAGVVGRIYTTTEHTAEVMLIVDDRSAFGAAVLRSGAPVLVEGTGQGNSLRLKPLIKEIDIEIGDEIVTSSMSGVFPDGLPVGKVVDIDRGEYGLLLTAEISPHVDLARVQRVFVLKRDQAAPQ
ncbi:MAG: rod shape-determining protein MreC [Firmicutes bacterium]|nr:rod shape-determining protein MreC [Bacillota bacterium]